MACKKPLFILSLVLTVGMLSAFLLDLGVSATNTIEFCTSCHSMKGNLEEYKQSAHWKNPSGVRATCADCHVPKAFGPKVASKVLAARDVAFEIIGTIDTPEKFEAHRWAMASRVWRRMEENDSRECRGCHEWDQMDLAEQERIARKRHVRAREEGGTCIDCHKGIAHEEPDEPEGSTPEG